MPSSRVREGSPPQPVVRERETMGGKLVSGSELACDGWAAARPSGLSHMVIAMCVRGGAL